MKEAIQLTTAKSATITKSEYSVEFECIAKFLVCFEDASGLTPRQIVAKATEIADKALGPGGSMMVERSSKEGSYAIAALGVDRSSAHVMNGATHAKPALRLVK